MNPADYLKLKFISTCDLFNKSIYILLIFIIKLTLKKKIYNLNLKLKKWVTNAVNNKRYQSTK